MMTREELYGGSIIIDFPIGVDTIQLPDKFDTRLVYVTRSDSPTGTRTLRLPDPQTIRQHGWLVFFIYNSTGSTVNVETATGTLLGFLSTTEAFCVGLISAEFPLGGGTWTLVKKGTDSAIGSQISEIISLGSTVGLNDAADSYEFTADTWVVNSSLPIDSGDGSQISAGEFPVSPSDIDTYYGQLQHFYRWFPTSTTVRTTPNYDFDQTGLGVITGSVIGDLMHIANAGLQPLNADKMEAFDVPTNTWTVGVDFPGFVGIPNAPTPPEISICQSLGVETFNEFAFISPSTLDTSQVFVAYDRTNLLYLVAAYPPWPSGPFRPSCIGIDSRLHFQGGSYSSASGVANSTDSHKEFNPTLNTWQTLPPLPVIGRGLGILGFAEPRDRYNFGMGETTSVPSEVHFEYNLSTRTYRARATFSWGTGREERESAWAVHLV